VDLQVEAIWAALLHEWQLGYINPPPTYADTREGVMPLDSQRLRTPSSVRRARMGTCIDLALLFAACLELVDIHPVIFLLDGHALPAIGGTTTQAQYRNVLDPGDGDGVDAGDGSATPPGGGAMEGGQVATASAPADHLGAWCRSRLCASPSTAASATR
jgi:hypothetical protein